MQVTHTDTHTYACIQMRIHTYVHIHVSTHTIAYTSSVAKQHTVHTFVQGTYKHTLNPTNSQKLLVHLNEMNTEAQCIKCSLLAVNVCIYLDTSATGLLCWIHKKCRRLTSSNVASSSPDLRNSATTAFRNSFSIRDAILHTPERRSI